MSGNFCPRQLVLPSDADIKVKEHMHKNEKRNEQNFLIIWINIKEKKWTLKLTQQQTQLADECSQEGFNRNFKSSINGLELLFWDYFATFHPFLSRFRIGQLFSPPATCKVCLLQRTIKILICSLLSFAVQFALTHIAALIWISSFAHFVSYSGHFCVPISDDERKAKGDKHWLQVNKLVDE